ncbi:serine hydrolase domain-containing protein [Mycolicibacterium tusciae]|uniref:serine hydrolase domain-containing protein n=1 Tax=Mycolicibacterium tusciae TaxID=75922 RepID=UPI00024A2A10|nr:serine hydrolase domain-containing protein [Mycolicibacterium tusciae]
MATGRGAATVKGWPALLAVVLLVGACAGGGDSPQTHAPPRQESTAAATGAAATDPELAARSQSVLDGSVEADEPGCSAAVGVEGNVVWAGARGLADLETGAPITEDTAFDIASVSKQFTAAAILLLAQTGKLSLDDTLATHVPGLPAWAQTVTVAQVMNQTSGIPDYIGLLEDEGYEYSDRTTQEQALRALADAPELQFEPGERFDYSNSNYFLLGEIVARVSGQPLPAFLRAEIFKPLDLAMVMDFKAIPGSALPYEYDEDTRTYNVAVTAWEQVGDGGVQTTPSQLVRWADNYRTGKVGGQALLDAQLTGAADTGDDGDRYGAGIFILSDGSLDHDGSWAGYVTAFHVSADRRTAVAVSCNTDTQDPGVIAEELEGIWI